MLQVLTGSTLSMPCRRVDGVFRRVYVTALALGDGSIAPSASTDPTVCIFFDRNGLEMVRVRATAISAEVIKNETDRDRANEQLV